MTFDTSQQSAPGRATRQGGRSGRVPPPLSTAHWFGFMQTPSRLYFIQEQQHLSDIREEIVAADNAALEANLEVVASSQDVLHLAVSAASEVNSGWADSEADLQAKRGAHEAKWRENRESYKAPRIVIARGEAERQASIE